MLQALLQNSINTAFTLCITQFPFLKFFPFLFLETFQLINSISPSFEPLKFEPSVSTYILFSVSKFSILVILWMPSMLLTMNKVNHIVILGLRGANSILENISDTNCFWYVQLNMSDLRSCSHTFWATNHKIFLKRHFPVW